MNSHLSDRQSNALYSNFFQKTHHRISIAPDILSLRYRTRHSVLQRRVIPDPVPSPQIIESQFFHGSRQLNQPLDQFRYPPLAPDGHGQPLTVQHRSDVFYTWLRHPTTRLRYLIRLLHGQTRRTGTHTLGMQIHHRKRHQLQNIKPIACGTHVPPTLIGAGT